MQLFNQILYPTDFSEASNHAMKYAVYLCKQFKANLLVLYAYRLIDEWSLEGTQINISLKERLEMQARNKFSIIENEMLSSANINYKFLSDVGFFSDRILANIQAYQVDLLLLSHSMHHAIADNMQDLLINQGNRLIMYIPLHFMQPNLNLAGNAS